MLTLPTAGTAVCVDAETSTGTIETYTGTVLDNRWHPNALVMAVTIGHRQAVVALPDCQIRRINGTLFGVVPDADDRVVLTTTKTYCVATVVTRNSVYQVVTRNGRHTVICPDGVAVQGDTLTMHKGTLGDRMRLRDGQRDLLLTTTVKEVHILEN
jgi:hypothetical protein